MPPRDLAEQVDLAYASRPHAQRSATARSARGAASLKAAQRHHIDERSAGARAATGLPATRLQKRRPPAPRVIEWAAQRGTRPVDQPPVGHPGTGTRAVDHLADDLGAATAGKRGYRTTVARARLEELRPSVTVAPRQRTHRQAGAADRTTPALATASLGGRPRCPNRFLLARALLRYRASLQVCVTVHGATPDQPRDTVVAIDHIPRESSPLD